MSKLLTSMLLLVLPILLYGQETSSSAAVLKLLKQAVCEQDVDAFITCTGITDTKMASRNLEKLQFLKPYMPDFKLPMIRIETGDKIFLYSFPVTVRFPGMGKREMAVTASLQQNQAGKWFAGMPSLTDPKSIPDMYPNWLDRFGPDAIHVADNAPDWLRPSDLAVLAQIVGIKSDLERIRQEDLAVTERLQEVNADKEKYEAYFAEPAPESVDVRKFMREKPATAEEREHWFSTARKLLGNVWQAGDWWRDALIKNVSGLTYRKDAPRPAAGIDILYHATFDPKLAGTAVYNGLSTPLWKKPPHVIDRFVDLCMMHQSVSRILWGTRKQRPELQSALKRYLESGDEKIAERAAVLDLVFANKLDWTEWHTAQRAQRQREVLGDEKLNLVRTILDGTDSGAKRLLLKRVIRPHKLFHLFDETFAEPLKKCLKDEDPFVREMASHYYPKVQTNEHAQNNDLKTLYVERAHDSDHKVREQAAVVLGGQFLWGKQPQDPEIIDLMLKLSRDPRCGVRKEAVYYGLSVVRDESEAVIRRLIEMATDSEEDRGLKGRARWRLRRSDLAAKLLREAATEGDLKAETLLNEIQNPE